MELFKEYEQLFYIIAGALLLLLLAFLAMKSFSGRMRGGRGNRLGIVEYHTIDNTRRLVLVRRDDTEHLLMIGGGQDIVVESNIGEMGMPPAYAPPPQMQPRMAPPMMQPQMPPPHLDQYPDPTMTPRPAPRPAVFGARRPPRPLDPGEPL
jgi:hypothetical protein